MAKAAMFDSRRWTEASNAAPDAVLQCEGLHKFINSPKLPGDLEFFCWHGPMSRLNNQQLFQPLSLTAIAQSHLVRHRLLP